MKRRRLERRTRRIAAIQRYHTIDRVRERHNLNFSREDCDRLALAIVTGKSMPAARLTSSKVVHIVELDGFLFPCVYDRLRKSVATVLPWPYCVLGSI